MRMKIESYVKQTKMRPIYDDLSSRNKAGCVSQTSRWVQ
jgi:hypothetical protein